MGENIIYPNSVNTREAFYIGMELVANGTLFDYIFLGGQFSETMCRYYFKQILCAVECLHQVGYTHNDIKPENIMLDWEFNIKLVDFGFISSIKGKDGNEPMYSGTRGTMEYFCP